MSNTGLKGSTWPTIQREDTGIMNTGQPAYAGWSRGDVLRGSAAALGAGRTARRSREIENPGGGKAGVF